MCRRTRGVTPRAHFAPNSYPAQKNRHSQNIASDLASQKLPGRICFVLLRTDTRGFAEPNTELDAAFPAPTFPLPQPAPDNSAYDCAVARQAEPRCLQAGPRPKGLLSRRDRHFNMRPYPGHDAISSPPNANALQSPVPPLHHTGDPASPTPQDRSQTHSGDQLAQPQEPAAEKTRRSGSRGLRSAIIRMATSNEVARRSIPPYQPPPTMPYPDPRQRPAHPNKTPTCITSTRFPLPLTSSLCPRLPPSHHIWPAFPPPLN